MSPEQESEFNLLDYLQVVRRRKGLIILVMALAVIASLVVSNLQTPVYAGTAELLLQSRSNEFLFDPTGGQRGDPTRANQTQIRLIESPPVQAAVREKLGSAPPVSASPLGGTDVIEVKAESIDPELAAAIANAYVTAYIAFRRKQAVDDILAASEQIQSKISDLQKPINELRDRIASIPLCTGTNPPPNCSQRIPLENDFDALTDAQAVFKQKLDQLQVDGSLRSGGAQLVTLAATPTVPVSPKPMRSAATALAMGLLLGVALAFLGDYLDDSVKDKEDFERVVPDLPVIGMIPAVNEWKDKNDAVVISATAPKSAAAEAYRTLRTGVQFLGLERPMGIVQVTSANAQEGKTTTIANLAVALASAGERVVVVCCDLRRPRIHDFFGLTNEIGFTSVLLGKVPLSGALQEAPNQPRVYVLASGPLPPNPSELLSSRRTVEVLTSLRAEADFVLLDAPPVLPVTDALVLSGRVDATLLVCVAGATARKEVARAAELLRQVDAPLVGAVLNGVSERGAYGDSNQYYRYEEPTERRAAPKPAPATNGRSRKKVREPIER